MDNDLASLKLNEALRRMSFIKDFTDSDEFGSEIKKLSKRTGIKASLLKQWRVDYTSKGLDGLQPVEWDQLTLDSWEITLQKKAELGKDIDTVFLSKEIIEEIANRNTWSYQKAKRIVMKYREGGLLALGSPPKRR